MEIKLEQRRSNIGTFYIEKDGERPAKMDFLIKDGVMNIYHTEVSPELQGTGVGEQLIAAGVKFARENNLKVLPTCTFARSVFDRVKEYQDLLAPTLPSREGFNNLIMLDIFIIGGGPIGLACGLAAQKAGLSYVIVEKGCLVNSLYNYPSTMTFFSTSELLEIGGIPFVTISNKPTRAEALEYYRRVAFSNHLKVNLFEEVTGIGRTDGHYTITTSKATYEAKNIIVSTGFYDIPVKLDIPGEELPKVKHYYKDPHYYALQRVIVVGSSNSAIDVALETYRKGAEVTLVIRGSEVSNRVKYWVRPDILNRIKEGSIKVYFNSHLAAVREFEADIQTPDGLITIPNDYVMAMTGYKPNFDFLNNLGIALSDEGKFLPQYNPDTMETNQKGMYLAGVVCGGMDTHLWFIENSRIHAEMILKDIVGKVAPPNPPR